MLMDNIQLIILIVTILGAVFAQSRVILSRMSALESRMSALEDRMSALESRVSALESRVSALESRVSHMEGLFEGFRAAGLLPLSQSDKNQAQAA